MIYYIELGLELSIFHGVHLFVCLFNRLVRADTRMGSEGTKLKIIPGFVSFKFQHE